uniref:HP domain-containing protein n=1 Tax=Angiostrongylus cantonensis TaxID=6313 RepID=A0A158PB33_ANGCA
MDKFCAAIGPQDGKTEGRKLSSKDFDAILNEIKKPVKNPAPRGRADTTCSTPVRESMGSKEAERRARRLEMLRERQLHYQKQELNLGGYHDVFNDTCPEFKPRVASHEESVMTSDDESVKTTQIDAASVGGSADLVPPGAHNDSLENVLSKMRVTPKKVNRVVKRGIFTRLPSDFTSAVDSNASERTPQTTFESHPSAADVPVVVEKINETFVIEKTNKTFLIEENPNAGKNVDIPDTKRDIPNAPNANNTNSAEVVFAVPAVPTKASKAAVKTTLHQREERANNSEKKNTSILETMDLDLRSPGRTLFASFPPNKKRSLATTPIKTTSSHNGDAMEMTIEMSDISQQPSVESDDDSVVDPVTDPRPTEATPSRCTTSSNIPLAPINSAVTPFRRPVTNLSASERWEVIQRSVERLSKPRTRGHCRRVTERCESNDQISPYPGTTSNGAQPVTPFEPIDPYRMFAPHAGRSGTARRVPPIKRRTALLSRSSLFAHDMEVSNKPRDSLGDKSGGTKAAVDPVEDKQVATSLIPSGHDECNHTALSVANNPEVLILTRPVIPSSSSTSNVRRSMRNRMKPVRRWLGEKPVYTVSPGGGRTLVGVTEVEVRDKRWLKFKTADFRLAKEREQQLAAHRRFLREKRKQEARARKQSRLLDLQSRHERGMDLDITADSIVTSSEDEDSD